MAQSRLMLRTCTDWIGVILCMDVIKIILLSFLVVSCDMSGTGSNMGVQDDITDALNKVGLRPESISLPKIGTPVSVPGRFQVVDEILGSPYRIFDLGDRIKELALSHDRSTYIIDVLDALGLGSQNLYPEPDAKSIEEIMRMVLAKNVEAGKSNKIPSEVEEDQVLSQVIYALLNVVAHVDTVLNAAGTRPTESDLQNIRAHVDKVILNENRDPEVFNRASRQYHESGSRIELAMQATVLINLLSVIEDFLPELEKVKLSRSLVDWQSPLGTVRISGTGDDTHEGVFLILIDLGGNDIYTDVTSGSDYPSISIVIDMDGDDTVKWEKKPGPGSGVLGTGIWLDLAGDDRYRGGTIGLGASLLGSGLFWDEKGNDTYEGDILVQGAAQYGIGIFVDSQGDDHYQAEMASQGFGGTGGMGILADLSGKDIYTCGERYPDPVKARARRHQGTHYLSLCQGYSYGMRPDISGGIGLLLDKAGDDVYKADIFAQGAAYWFGLGLLIDHSGNDIYKAYEHAQGESLHIGAGFLGDWSGDDKYIAYEHAQGVGMDRALGVLYDATGNDFYQSNHESQGAGIKPYGVGLLVDQAGKDYYKALRDSQGIAKPDRHFPGQWPIGVLLDLEGTDEFEQPYTEDVGKEGRVQNRQGIAVDK